MKLTVGARVRVVGVHERIGTIVEVFHAGRAANVDFDGCSGGPALCIAEELEPVTPCACAWCETGGAA